MKLGSYKTFFPALILILFLGLTLVSCSGSSTSQGVNGDDSGAQADTETAGDAETAADEETLTDEEIEELAEEVREEEVDIVDYENAIVGAEIKGFIPALLCSDADNYIKIEITNTSDFTWGASGTGRVAVGYHFWGQDVNFQEYDNPTRSSLPNNVEPGETVFVEVLIDSIENKGAYVVQIDLVLEGNFWFSSKDAPMVEGKVFFTPCMEN